MGSAHGTITVEGHVRSEIVDTAAGASRGGCNLPVAHTGRRPYDTLSVDAVEAGSRRGCQVEFSRSTPGRIDVVNPGDKQAGQSTDVGAPVTPDLGRVRTVLR
jgi:uncharacterized protein (DUF2126 family)